MHVYRWDLDRTYLDTDIGSVRALLRHAFETASEKKNIPGSATLLRCLTEWDPSSKVTIVSGSPTQLRAVLEEKLALDGVRFDSLILKDSLANLKRGRLRAVRGQIGYKLPQLFKQRVGLGPPVRETLFGDDWEVDAVVYSLYADAIAGRLTEGDLARVMEAGGAYDDAIREALRSLRQIGRADVVEDIFIHCDRGTPTSQFRALGPRVVPVFSWFQAAVLLWARGRLPPPAVAQVARACTDEAHISEIGLGGLAQDISRRGQISRDRMKELFSSPGFESMRPSLDAALDRLGEYSAPPTDPNTRDYHGFLRANAQRDE